MFKDKKKISQKELNLQWEAAKKAEAKALAVEKSLQELYAKVYQVNLEQKEQVHALLQIMQMHNITLKNTGDALQKIAKWNAGSFNTLEETH